MAEGSVLHRKVGVSSTLVFCLGITPALDELF